MRKFFLLNAVIWIIILTSASSAVQNAGPAWNLYAAQYGFAAYPQSAGARFTDAYSGSDFNSDFAAILGRVAQAMGAQPPTIGGDELFNASLESWPDRSGT